MRGDTDYEHLLRQADRIHRFPAKMAPRLAYSFLQPILHSNEARKLRFHEPMSGSGSSALVARSLGTNVSACDILYPAFTITQAKLLRLRQSSLEEMIESVSHLDMSGKRRPRNRWPNWQIWFRPRVLRCLEDMADCLSDERQQIFFPHLLTAFFQTVWDVSAADKKIMVPTRSEYSQEPPHLSVKELLGNFNRRVHRILAAQNALAGLDVSLGKPSVRQSNSLVEAGWSDQLKDVIFTSPAYGCGIDYERVFRLQMRVWTPFQKDTIIDPRSSLVGRTAHLGTDLDALPESEKKSAWYRTVRRSDPARLRMFTQYVNDLETFLRLCRSHLSKKGILGFVIGNPQISKQRIPLTRIVQKLAEAEGLRLEEGPRCDPIRKRTQNFRLRSATGPMKEEFLISFRLS